MPGVLAPLGHVRAHPELVAERLMRFAECVGRDNLMAGTDCGFSQSPLAGRVHRSIMWAKLRTLAEGGAIASKMAWGGKRSANGRFRFEVQTRTGPQRCSITPFGAGPSRAPGEAPRSEGRSSSEIRRMLASDADSGIAAQCVRMMM